MKQITSILIFSILSCFFNYALAGGGIGLGLPDDLELDVNSKVELHPFDDTNIECRVRDIEKLTKSLTEKYEILLNLNKNNKAIQKALHDSQLVWSNYYKAQCIFEGLVVKKEKSEKITDADNQCKTHVLCQRLEELNDIADIIK